MKLTLEEAKQRMDQWGSLNLSGTPITTLPDNLTVGGSLDLSRAVPRRALRRILGGLRG